MRVVLTGRDLTRAELIRVARGGEPVALDPTAIATMRASRAIVERSLERAEPVYGLSTAVGVLKRVPVSGPEAAEYSRRMIRHHLVGQGPNASPDLTRATMLRLANGFAGGSVGVRPVLAERLVAALNEGRLPPGPHPGLGPGRPTSPRWPTSRTGCSPTWSWPPARAWPW